MPRHTLRWHKRLQFSMEHRLSAPVYHFFSRFPQYEYGLARPTVATLTCPHSPLAGRRAVQISDLHLDEYHPRHDVVLRSIRDLRPDWIFITGDLLNLPKGIPHLFRFLSALRLVAPVFLTLGNHDHYSGVPVDHFAELADRHKLHLLINQAMFIPLESGELGIVGLDDPSTHRADPRCIPQRVPGRFTVMLAHAPNVVDLLDESHAVDVVLCGHSHGGQWRVPYLPPVWLPYGCRGRTGGHYVHNGSKLYVNRGLGWSILPIRWNCPPEILLIEWVEGSQVAPS